MLRIIAIVLVSAALLGCAGSGRINWDNARQVKDGMTAQEVTALMGAPHSVTSKGPGQQVWVWVHVNGMTGSSQSAALNFKDGKVVKAFDIPDSFK